MNERSYLLAIVFLFVIVAALAYVEWWQGGELVALNERLSVLGGKLSAFEAKPKPARRSSPRPGGDAA